jgi:hypothetical protein
LDGELKEIVDGIIYNSSYSREQKKELLSYYSEMMGSKVMELAAKGGFKTTSKQEESQDDTPPTPPRCQ